ncbi:MAG TPA: isoprenylcysteine carboxylmethyltransferase family protein [Vicinamibacterales bacterium]|nr:isoprenylcysteine carboxylmethyltransferase family protein [Vicinamibacterales bacterium]
MSTHPSGIVSGPIRGDWRQWYHDRWSDVAGAVCFAGLAAWTLTRMPEVGVFLLPTLTHELFVAIAFLLRDRPKAVHSAPAARAVAYGGTFLILGFFHAARTWWPGWLAQGGVPQIAVLGAILWLAGSLLVIFSVWSLRYAFSIEPEARRVVRSGAYTFVRHPIYLGYVLQYGGVWLIYPSAALGLVLLVWLGLTLARIRFEEHVLAQTFPQYDEYRRRTGALFPRLLRPRAAAPVQKRAQTA